MLNPFSFRLISSHRNFFWKLLIASHCHRSLPISSQLISCLLSFFRLLSSHPVSCPLSRSQLFPGEHHTSLLSSCHLSLPNLFSSTSAYPGYFPNLHSFTQFFSAPSSSCRLIFLSSHPFFSHLLNSSRLISAFFSSSYLSTLVSPKT